MSTDPATVCLVTVTYGSRQKLLEAMLASLRDVPAIRHAVVIGNGTPWLDDVAVDHLPFTVEKIPLPRNMGTAAAFTAGLRAALATRHTFIWLMDDDLIPSPGSCEALVDAIAAEEAGGHQLVGVIAQREGHTLDLSDRHIAKPGSFLAFDIRRRLPQRKSGRKSDPTSGTARSLPFAPYGGFMARPQVFETIGEPRADFVLYADDTEYSSRILRHGGVIKPVPSARVTDVVPSWNVGDENEPKSGLDRMLGSGTGFQVYYSLRNRCYFDHTRAARQQGLWYRLNRTLFLGTLFVKALRKQRLSQFRLIRRAIRDGEKARLGLNAEFPLPA